MFSWARTFYAKYEDNYFQFEMKKQRDFFVKELGFTAVPATEAYEHYGEIRRADWRKIKAWQQKRILKIR